MHRGIWISIVTLAFGNVTASAQGARPVRIGFESPAAADLFTTVAQRDQFGFSVAYSGDLNGDGNPEILVGAPGANDDRGRVYVLSLSLDGSVLSYSIIDDRTPLLADSLHDEDEFGSSVAWLGDLDGDGRTDIAVGAPGTDGVGIDRGAVWLLSLDRTGRPTAAARMGSESIFAFNAGNCGGNTPDRGLCDFDRLGASLAVPGDLDGDGDPELLIGSVGYDVVGTNSGAVWIVHLQSGDGAITPGDVAEVVQPEFGRPAAGSQFGAALTNRTDPETIVVGAPYARPAGRNLAGSLISASSDETGPMGDQRVLADGGQINEEFGSSIAEIGDLDQNGVRDLVVGATGVNDGRGDVRYLFLTRQGQVQASISIVDQLEIDLQRGDNFGRGVTALPGQTALDPDRLIVGAPWDSNRGSIWVFTIPVPPVPVVEEVNVTPEMPVVGGEVSLTAHADDPVGISVVRAFLKRGGDASYFSVDMSHIAGDEFRATIPQKVVTSRGLEYYIEVENTVGLRSRFPDSGFLSLSLGVESESVFVQHGSETGGYRLVSVPLKLDDADAVRLLEPQLGRYRRSEWRFFGQLDGRLVELDRRDFQLEPGRAYWILVKERDRVLQTGPGTTLPTNRPYRIPLTPEWNLVSTPFNFPVSIHNVHLASGTTLDIHGYDGSSWNLQPFAIRPAEGYALWVEAADTLIVDPVAVSEVNVDAQARAATVAGARVLIHARKGKSRDANNAAIMISQAADGVDRFDRRDPPNIGDHVSVYFDSDGRKLSVDAKAVSTEECSWDVVVTAATPGRVDLAFEEIETITRRASVTLIDPILELTVDLRQTPHYGLALDGSTLQRRLRLVVSNDGFGADRELPVPEGQMIVFPNPFSGAVTVRYGVASDSDVRLDVFDVLGRRIDTVVERLDQPAGVYAEVWTPGALAPGAYVLALTIDGRPIDAKTATLSR